MKKQALKECLDILRRIQALKHDELSPSVAAELANVTARLQLLLDTDDDDVKLDRRTVMKTLKIIGKVAVGLDWVRRIAHWFPE
ncbi:MAG: hypothetical protein IT495_00090 [Gammaproteobacteria bacterium]|nr:hypothetical protein [Gammaproteobacteria bacterium]